MSEDKKYVINKIAIENSDDYMVECSVTSIDSFKNAIDVGEITDGVNKVYSFKNDPDKIYFIPTPNDKPIKVRFINPNREFKYDDKTNILSIIDKFELTKEEAEELRKNILDDLVDMVYKSNKSTCTQSTFTKEKYDELCRLVLKDNKIGGM